MARGMTSPGSRARSSATLSWAFPSSTATGTITDPIWVATPSRLSGVEVSDWLEKYPRAVSLSMAGSSTRYGTHSETLPVAPPILRTKLIRTTISEGVTTSANWGSISVPTRRKRTGTTVDHASVNARAGCR